MQERPSDQPPIDRPTERPTDRPIDRPADRTPTDKERERAMRENDLNRRDTMPADRTDRAAREPMWSGMGDIRRRFDELQVQFVEEPQTAVRKAEELLKEAVDKMASSMHERVNSIHGELGDGSSDTERLRQAMQRLRRMVDSFVDRPAA